jgi:hypothetical protein
VVQSLPSYKNESNAMALIPDDPKTLLSRRAVAEALTVSGHKTAPATLARLASVGGGPPFRKYGRWPVYPWDLALAWAQSRLTPLVLSTSALDALRSCASAEGSNPPVTGRQRKSADQPAQRDGSPAAAQRGADTGDQPDAG